MTTPTLDELLDVWGNRAGDIGVGTANRWSRSVLDLLANGQPIDPKRLAAATGMSLQAAAERLGWARDAGYEFDDSDRLVGAALSLNPTEHHFRIRGRDLYAWCGFDTLFLPILLDEPANVISTCPDTGTTIRLHVAADGTVSDLTPASTVLAVVGVEITACCPTTGPGSAVCTQMPFLAHQQAALHWLNGRSGIAILSIPDATRLAQAYATTET